MSKPGGRSLSVPQQRLGRLTEQLLDALESARPALPEAYVTARQGLPTPLLDKVDAAIVAGRQAIAEEA